MRKGDLIYADGSKARRVNPRFLKCSSTTCRWVDSRTSRIWIERARWTQSCASLRPRRYRLYPVDVGGNLEGRWERSPGLNIWASGCLRHPSPQTPLPTMISFFRAIEDFSSSLVHGEAEPDGLSNLHSETLFALHVCCRCSDALCSDERHFVRR